MDDLFWVNEMTMMISKCYSISFKMIINFYIKFYLYFLHFKEFLRL